MVEPTVAGETVAQLFSGSAQARDAVQRLRSAGFADVRISERDGDTSAEHVAPEAGLTEVDFEASLARAGFDTSAVRIFTRDIARGHVLVTIAAGSRIADAVAALRGERVAAPSLHPVDDAPNAAAVAPVSPAAAVPGAVPAGVTDAQVMQLRAERLAVEKERETHEARVRRVTVTEQQTITVPVQHDELVVERDGVQPVRVPLGEPRPPAP